MVQDVPHVELSAEREPADASARPEQRPPRLQPHSALILMLPRRGLSLQYESRASGLASSKKSGETHSQI